MGEYSLMQIHKANEMHFIYAAFAENDGWIYVKVGMSSRPFRRIAQWATGCPFDITKIVFAQAGSKSKALGVERSIHVTIPQQFRMWGEWMRFRPDQGKQFSSIATYCFKHITGRDLKWTAVDMKQFKREYLRGYLASMGADLSADIDKTEIADVA